MSNICNKTTLSDTCGNNYPAFAIKNNISFFLQVFISSLMLTHHTHAHVTLYRKFAVTDI